MITIKSTHELKIMQKAGQISQAALLAAGGLVAPGVTTRELDEAARKVIKKASWDTADFPPPSAARSTTR